MKNISLKSFFLTAGSFVTIFNFSLYGKETPEDPIRENQEESSQVTFAHPSLSSETPTPSAFLEKQEEGKERECSSFLLRDPKTEPMTLRAPEAEPSPLPKKEREELYREALKKQEEGKAQEALACFEKAAQEGHPDAAFYTATYYDIGIPESDIPQDLQKAVEFYEMAAKESTSCLEAAAYRLSQIFQKGAEGVPQDLQKAKKFREVCNERGYLVPIEALEEL